MGDKSIPERAMNKEITSQLVQDPHEGWTAFELRKAQGEIGRLNAACALWLAEHVALLHAISEAGFLLKYEKLPEPTPVGRVSRPYLVPLNDKSPAKGSEALEDSQRGE